MANALTNYGKGQILSGNIDPVNDDLYVMLITDSHTPDIDAEEFIDDVSANEASGTGYTAGGKIVANAAITVDDTNDRAYLDFDNLVWTTTTLTYRYAYLYKNTGTPATSTIIGYYDPGSNQSVTTGTLTIAPAAPASGGALYIA